VSGQNKIDQQRGETQLQDTLQVEMSSVLTAGGTDITPMIANLCAKSAQRKDVANTPERNAPTQNDGRRSSAGEVDALRQEDVDKHRATSVLLKTHLRF
jgi:predicted Ser/Thr protein kinase